MSAAFPVVQLPDRGRVGMACLIVTESAFFAIFLVAYLFYIGKSANGPQPSEVLEFPWLGTLCLFTSSASIVLAVRALRRDAEPLFRVAWLATLLLGAAFLGVTAEEWQGLITEHGLTIRSNLFGTTYFALVGFHAAHVALGVTAMALVLVLSALGYLGVGQAERVEMLSWYWHFVDAVWVAVLTVVYIIGV